jgi:hypothetical protein
MMKLKLLMEIGRARVFAFPIFILPLIQFYDLPLPANSETCFAKLLPGTLGITDVADGFLVRPALFPRLAHRARA